MQKGNIEKCIKFAADIATGATLAKELNDAQCRLLETRIDIARHFCEPTDLETNVEIDVMNCAVSTCNTENQKVIATLTKIAAEIENDAKEAMKLSLVSQEPASSVRPKKKTASLIDLSELKTVQDEYLADPAFCYFENKSRMASGTNLSTRLPKMDGFVAKMTGYDVAIKNYNHVAALIEQHKRSPKTIRNPQVKAQTNQTAKALDGLQAKIRNSIEECELKWTTIIESIDVNDKIFDSLDRDTVTLVAQEMAFAGMQVGSVTKIRIPLMDTHDVIVEEVKVAMATLEGFLEKISHGFTMAKLATR